MFAVAVLAITSKPGTSYGQSSPNLSVCEKNNSTRTIYYNVASFAANGLPVNGWGDHFHKAYMYALSNPEAHPNKSDILDNINLASPIVLRANVGDCIVIKFRNDIVDKRAGMNISGLVYDPKVSDGSKAGNNPDTTVAFGEEITYVFYAPREGQFPINDFANINTSQHDSTMTLGLYGGFIVEPKDSVWTNPVSGSKLLEEIAGKLTGVGSIVFADIEVPGGDGANPNDFRDFALVFMDENEEIANEMDSHPKFPTTGFEDSTFGFNYRSEPVRNRVKAILDHRAGKIITLPDGKKVLPEDHFCDGFDNDLTDIPEDPSAKCMSEEVSLQSWPFGDPGKLIHKEEDGKIVVDSDNLIPKAYVGDPIRFRLIHPGEKEHHSFHQHQHRWFHESNDTSSARNDVQLTGPGETYQLNYEVGAGSGPGSPGDTVFHCHLYPHFAQGFWGIFRTFDKLRNSDFNQLYPDGTPLEALKELPDRIGLTASPTENNPGFPLFVKGQFLQKGYKPPNFVTEDPYKEDSEGKPLRRPGDTIRQPNDLERANMAGNNGKPGNDTTPGVFYTNPCPASSPERIYHPVAIDTDPDNFIFKSLMFNEQGNGTGKWQDPDARIYVEKSHVDNILAGKEKAEPYTIRVKDGECARIQFTNKLHEDDMNRPENQNKKVPLDIHADGETDLLGKEVFHQVNPMSEVSIHTHLFMYDTLASDGTSVGWNYDQSALAGQTIESRFFVDLNLRTVFFHDHQFPNTGQQHGLYAVWNVEPENSSWEKPDGSPSDGVGPNANIVVPGGTSFREFTLFYADFVPAFRPAPDLPGNQGTADLMPVFPRGMQGPEDYGADQGAFLINYRNEPFQIRINPHLPSATLKKNDPAYLFSSTIFGDPSTPVLKAYPGDPVVVRHVQGSQEEQHNLHINGHRWLHDPDDPKSSIYDVQSLNIAEFFNYELQGTSPEKKLSGILRARQIGNLQFGATKILLGGVGGAGDYFYGSLPVDDLWNGMWGIMRVLNKQMPELKPLPSNPAPNGTSEWAALKPGEAIKKAPGSGNPCPLLVKNISFKLGVVNKKIIYNKEGENDPNGLMYVRLDRLGKPIIDNKPLFLRVNEGECVTVTLKNLLPKSGIPIHNGDTHTPEDIFPKKADGTICNIPFGPDACGVEEEEKAEDAKPRWPASLRVSMHPHLLKYNVIGSDGATVGYNYDQTVGPGETITYKWYADTKDLGIANLADYGDIRGHRHHGLFAGLIVEPKSSSYYDPSSGRAQNFLENSVIRYPENGSTKIFREFIIAFQDGLNLYDSSNKPIPDLKEHPGDAQNFLTPRKTDPEDQGHKGINFRAERLDNRLKKNPENAWLFSSDPLVGHGDPSTPIFKSYIGDDVKIRFFNPQDKPRGHSFTVHGHNWLHEPNDPNSNVINTQGGIDTGRAFNINLIGGAGGGGGADGDFLYRSSVFFNHFNDGLWGIIRVLGENKPELKSLKYFLF